MCNVKYVVDLNRKESGERKVAMDQVTLNLDFGFCKFQGEMYSKKEVRQGNHMDQIF